VAGVGYEFAAIECRGRFFSIQGRGRRGCECRLGYALGALLIEFSDRVIDRAGEFATGMLNGLMKRFGMIGNDNGIETGNTSLHHAALVGCPGLLAVLVVQMHFDPRYPSMKMRQRCSDGRFYVDRQAFPSDDVVIAIDLNFHASS
jgi:hypothetical protein